MSIQQANFETRKQLMVSHGPKLDITLYRHDHASRNPKQWTWSVVTSSDKDTTTYQYGLFSEALAQFQRIERNGINKNINKGTLPKGRA